MALSYNLAYQEIISVNPTRRQIFAGKTDSTFPNNWQWVIYCLWAALFLTNRRTNEGYRICKTLSWVIFWDIFIPIFLIATNIANGHRLCWLVSWLLLPTSTFPAQSVTDKNTNKAVQTKIQTNQDHVRWRKQALGCASQVTWGSTLVPVDRNNQCESLFILHFYILVTFRSKKSVSSSRVILAKTPEKERMCTHRPSASEANDRRARGLSLDCVHCPQYPQNIIVPQIITNHTFLANTLGQEWYWVATTPIICY